MTDNVLATETITNESTNLSLKYNQDDWNAVEKQLNRFDKKIIACLLNLGNNTNTENLMEYFVMGEELYDLCRGNIVDKFSLNSELIETEQNNINIKNFINNIADKKQKKIKKPIIKKADKIKTDNALARVFKNLDLVLESFTDSEFRPHIAFNSDIVEIKGIGLLYCGKYLEQNKDKLCKKKNLPFVLSIIVTMQRFINVCTTFLGKSLVNNTQKTCVSKQLIEDINYWMNKLTKIYPYNGLIVCDYAPELLVYTEYDKAIPNTGVSPRKHQIDLHIAITKYFDQGFCLVYNPMIGLGKTSYAIGIASKIINLRQQAKYKYLQLIFACNLVSVKNQVANLCYNADIKFGIGSRNEKTGEYKITNHKTCKTDLERIVIVTSPEIANEILLDSKKDDIYGAISERYILFLDEPTIGADIENSASLRENISVMTSQPKRTILSSATFPNLDHIKIIIDTNLMKYPDMYIGTVYSDEIQIGCDVKTYDGTLIVPHLGIKSQQELKSIIQVIKACPFLGRIYTTQVVRSLWSKMHELHIENIPDINKLFANIDNLSANSVRQISMNMLNILSEQKEEYITKVCSSLITDKVVLKIEDDIIKESNQDFEWEQQDLNDDISSNSINFDMLGTKQAYRFLNMSLIAVPKPLEFINTHFKNLLADIKNANIDKGNKNNSNSTSKFKSLKNIMKHYHQEIEDYEKFVTSITKNTKDEIKLQQILQELVKPTIKFPEFCHINTVAHINHYASSHKSNIISRFVRTHLCLENLPIDKFSIDDDIVLLLFAGIGIYSNTLYDPVYSQKVLELASEGHLAYIIADSSICYGTNYPINRVFITDEFAKEHSMNTLFQLMGRAGRVGKSWIAEIFVSNIIANRIINYSRTMNETDIEAENMCKMFIQLYNEKQNRMIAKLKEIEDSIKLSMKKEEISKIAKIAEIAEISEQAKLIFIHNNEHINVEAEISWDDKVIVKEVEKVKIIENDNSDIYRKQRLQTFEKTINNNWRQDKPAIASQDDRNTLQQIIKPTEQKPIVFDNNWRQDKPATSKAKTAEQKPIVSDNNWRQDKLATSKAKTAEQKLIVSDNNWRQDKPATSKAKTAEQNPIVSDNNWRQDKPATSKAKTAEQKLIVSDNNWRQDKLATSKAKTAEQKLIVSDNN
jgi:hypothetical protein